MRGLLALFGLILVLASSPSIHAALHFKLKTRGACEEAFLKKGLHGVWCLRLATST